MAWRIEVYDVENTTLYDITSRTSRIVIDEKLGAESDSFSVFSFDIQLNHVQDQINIYKDNVLTFSGIILNQRDWDDSGKKQTEFQCVSWSYMFNNRVVIESYLQDDEFKGNPDKIIKDMIEKYATEFTTNNVKSSAVVIEQLIFQYTKLIDAITNVMDYLPTWYWYVDANKDVHMFENVELDGNDIKSINGKYNFKIDTLSVDNIGDEIANRVWIVGAKKAANEYIEQYFTGDGQQRYFTLAYEPNYVEVYVDGVLKKNKDESNNDEEQDFLVNKANKVIFIPDNITTPFTGKIKVKYKPTKQVIDYFENYESIKKFGLYEKVISNKNITDKLSARQYGKAEITRISKPKRVVSFVSKENFKIGQRCYVKIDHDVWDINNYFVVKSVRTTITTSEILYNVSLEELV